LPERAGRSRRILERLEKVSGKGFKEALNEKLEFNPKWLRGDLLVARSKEMKDAAFKMKQAAVSGAPVLIAGETGTGKEIAARFIHKMSDRATEPFVTVNCAALHDGIFESELFGHKKGSFTGATSDKQGFCEAVGFGTLFIDEIGELDLEQQKKILTLVEERIFYSVGSNERKSFNGVLVFATNKDLAKEVKNGKFREDLYYRIRSYMFEIEPLNNCKDKYLKVIEEINNCKLKQNKLNIIMSVELLNFLKTYHYPGNYRELRQIVDYIVFMASEKACLIHLPGWIAKNEIENLNSDCFYEAQGKFEKKFLTKKLTKYQGRINYTSEMINLSKVTLISKIKKYDINIKDMKINRVFTA
jgi:transcriptional regulator with PAS, ATPase and Fis domain